MTMHVPPPTPESAIAVVRPLVVGSRLDDAGVADVAAQWNCPCRGGCGSLKAVECLYQATMHRFEHSDSAFNPVVAALGVVVSRQKTLSGQAACRRYAEAMAHGDHAAALAVCHTMIAAEQERAAQARNGARGL